MFGSSARAWVVSSSSTSTHKSFSAGLLLACSSPGMCWFQELPWPRCGTLHFTLLSFMRLTPGPASWVHPGPSGYWPIPQACHLHLSAWGHWQTCWGFIWSHCWCHRWRSSGVPEGPLFVTVIVTSFLGLVSYLLIMPETIISNIVSLYHLLFCKSCSAFWQFCPEVQSKNLPCYLKFNLVLLLFSVC